MNKKILNFFLCGAMFVASAGMFVSCSDYDDDIKDLNQKIENLDKTLSGQIETKIQTVNTTIDGLKAQLSDLDEAYKAADAQLSEALKAADAAAQTGIAEAKAAAKEAMDQAEANKANIAALKKQVEDGIADLEATLAKLEEKHDQDVKTLMAKDEELNAAIIKAQNRADEAYKLGEDVKAMAEQNAKDIKANADAIKANKENIEANKKAIEVNAENIQKNADAIAKHVEAVNKEIKRIDETLVSLQNQINTLNDDLKAALVRIAANETAISTLKGRCDALEDRATEVEKRCDALEAKDVEHSAAIAKLQEDLGDLAEDLAQAKIDLKAYTDAQVAAATEVLNAKIDSLDESLNVRVDEVEEAYKAADVQLNARIDSLNNALSIKFGEIESAITKLNEDLTKYINAQIKDTNDAIKRLITGVIYQGKKGLIFYGKVKSDVKFPNDSINALEIKSGKYLIGNTSLTLFATVNPSNVDFTKTTLELIDSRNQANPVFELTPLVKSNELLKSTRAEQAPLENNGNGFYEMIVNPITSETATAPFNVNENALYALAADYKDVNGADARVTSKYAINLYADEAEPYTEFDWAGFKDAACKTKAGAHAGLSDFEFSYNVGETDYSSWLKITDVDSATVYKFYVDYDSAFFASAPEKKVYDGTVVEQPLKFVCKKDNLDKATTVTFYILNYDGTIVSKSYKLSYTQQLIANINIEKTVVPGARENSWNNDGVKYATVNFKSELLAVLDTIAEGKKFVEFFNKYTPTLNNTVFLSNTLTVAGDSVSEFTLVYDPLTCAVPSGDKNIAKFAVYDAHDHLITNITATMKVDTPTHLDSYLTAAMQNRIPAAFEFPFSNVTELVPGEDEIIAWAQYYEDGDDLVGGLWYNLDGAFNRLTGNGIVPDAEKAGKGGWTKSNMSKFQFTCGNSAKFDEGVTVYQTNGLEGDARCPYVVLTSNNNIRTVGEVVALDKKDADYNPYKGNDNKIELAEVINYYLSAEEGHNFFRTYRTDGKYFSTDKDAFAMQFVSPINFGLAAAHNTVAPVDVYITTVPRKDIEADVVFEDEFIDYSISSTTKFDLNDPRIKNITMELDKSNGNYGLMQNFKYTYTKTEPQRVPTGTRSYNPRTGQWEPDYRIVPVSQKVGKITFDYNSTSVNKEAIVAAKMYITDIWNVTSVLNVQFRLQGFAAGKKMK